MTVLRKLFVPAVILACGGFAGCASTTTKTSQSLAPSSSAAVAAASETGDSANLADSSGDAQDGTRSLAYEIENGRGKQARLTKKAPVETPQDGAAATDAVPTDQSSQAQLASPQATGEPDLPVTAMLPEQRPAGPMASLAAASEQRPVQVASLDPAAGLGGEQFDAAEQQPVRPMAAGVEAMKGGRIIDESGDAAHSRPAPDERIGPSSVEARSPELDQLIAHYATYYGVPETLVRRVAKRESTFNPRASNGPYVGLMQISVPTARGMGYRGNRAGLLDAETNLKYAVRYLRGAYLVARGNHDRADRLYQTGYYYHAKRAGLLDETGVGRDRKRRRM